MSRADFNALEPGVRAARDTEAAARLARARERAAPGARTEHHQFSGASMALTAEAYGAVDGLEPLHGLEDEGLERALHRHGIPVDRLASVRVTTSARQLGRAPRGLAVDLRRDSWLHRRSLRGAGDDADALAEAKTDTVSLVLPTREVAATIGPVLDAIAPLERSGLVEYRRQICLVSKRCFGKQVLQRSFAAAMSTIPYQH
jgi:hypothetical protein